MARTATFRRPLIINNTTPLPAAGSQDGTITFVHPGNIRAHNTTFYVRQGQAGNLAKAAAATRDQIIAAIKKVEYIFGSVVFRTFSAAELLTMQDILGHKQIDGALTVHYTNPLARAPFGEEVTSWDLRGVPEFQIRVTLNMPAAGTAFELEAISSIDQVANLDAQSGAFFGRFEGLRSYQTTLESGEKSYFGLPRTHAFARLWIFGKDGILPTRVRLKRDDILIYDYKQTAESPQLKAELNKYGKAPLLKADGTVDKVWPLLFNPNEFVSDLMEITPARTLELITDMPEKAQVAFIIEQISPVFGQ